MYQAIREFHFSYAHRLPGHEGKCQFLHGHNARCKIVAEASELGENGMVIDFFQMKQTIGRWLDEHLDHRTILQITDPLVPILHEADQPMFLMEQIPTSENLAQLILLRAQQLGIPAVEIRFWESINNCAIYRA